MDPGAAMRSVRYGVAAECSPAAPVLRETTSAESPKPKLLDRVRHAVRARHYSPRTEKAYVHWIKRYLFFHGKRHPGEMGAAEVTAFLTALAVRERVAASTQNQALNALLFLLSQPGGPDVPLVTQPALHRGATQDSKDAAASRIAGLPSDLQAKSGVFASMDAGRYTAPVAAFTVLRDSR